MSLRLLCALSMLMASAVSTVRAEEPAQDSVVVDAPTEQILQGALRWLVSKHDVNG